MSYLVAFDVAEDIARGGCPVCRAVARSGRKWLQTLMRADVTDASVRAAIQRSGGICPRHVQAAVQIAAEEGDRLGLALLSELLLGVASSRLAAPNQARPGRTRWLRRGAPVAGPKRCLACAAERRTSLASIDVLFNPAPPAISTRTLADGQTQMCLPHLDIALSHLHGGAEASRLARSVHHQLDMLASQVDGQLREHGRSPGDPEMDTTAGWRAARWLGGDPL